MAGALYGVALSVDLDEWYHSRRWVDGVQARSVPDTSELLRGIYGRTEPIGEMIAPTRALLDLFDRHKCRATFFVLGEVATSYAPLIREVADRGHEIGCHGLVHTDMSVLGADCFREHLREAVKRIEVASGQRPVGYRAPNLVYQPWATRILEQEGFRYDSSVCPSREVNGKYAGWRDAPVNPYRPSYEDLARPGNASLIEVPLPAIPIIRLPAGSGISARILGMSFTKWALRTATRTGNSSFYLHPWEVGARPHAVGHPLKNALFFRRTGPWLLKTLDRLLLEYRGRLMTVGESADQVDDRRAV